MSHSQSLLSLDMLGLEKIEEIYGTAKELKESGLDVSAIMTNRILCPIFLQESSRTFMNSTSSFIRMNGRVLPMILSNTRFGSKWAEPMQDFCTLVNSCCDFVVIRSPEVETIFEFNEFCQIPIINAGNGSGTGAEHPVQALVDLFTIQQEFFTRKLNILMMGGKHIRSARSQIKLFHRYGHELTIMSPISPVENSDIDEFCAQNLQEINMLDDLSLDNIDIIYHNGIDENPNVKANNRYILTREDLVSRGFQGKIMHSLPRKNELESCLDGTEHNLYFEQMINSKFIFQSIFKMQLNGCLHV